MKIIHVAPFFSNSGSSGGSYSVAFNLARALGAKGNQVILVSHSRGEGFQSIIHKNFREMVCDSVLMSKKLDPSSFLPTRRFGEILKEISTCNVLHVHLSRDIFPTLCCVFGLFMRKKVILQCHGMIISDQRILIRVLDFLVYKHVFKFAFRVLVLTEFESKRIPFHVKDPILFGNGVLEFKTDFEGFVKKNEIIFVGRINNVKRLDMFIKIVAKYNDIYPDTLPSKIFGPDGGALNTTLSNYQSLLGDKITYEGPISNSEILDILSSSKLLLVTSAFENFPMVVVESFAAGTPVLIYSHFDIAPLISEYFPEMVTEESDYESLAHRIHLLTELSEVAAYRAKIVNFAKEKFDINKLCNELQESIYE